jgi:tripartite-type tricarboxylate transporter receptor subunit TctC
MLIRKIAAALAAAALPLVAAAQGTYPNKPVTLIVPFAPGGGSDVVARTIQPKLAEKLGQSVLVENKPGAAGIIATNHVAKAAPDGYTLFLSWDSHAINPVVAKDLPYDTFKDFVPVTLLVKLPLVLGAWGGLPAGSVAEFVTLAKQNPGKYNYASVGSGSSNRLHSENFHRLAGINVVHVPYKGGGPSVTAMLTGEVAYSFLSLPSFKAQFDAGRLKPLAVTSTKRMPDLPNVPTMIESGFPGFEAYAWIGIFAPAGTPDAVVQRLHRDFTATLADPETAKKLAAVGVEIVGSTPQELDRFARSEYEKWARFARETKLTFEQ